MAFYCICEADQSDWLNSSHVVNMIYLPLYVELEARMQTLLVRRHNTECYEAECNEAVGDVAELVLPGRRAP